ncbi:MAG: transglutaminase family protein, partial [Planctomycetes bacterium]|nr:transglutaminase family protein [Planctomycetota bacterium]
MQFCVEHETLYRYSVPVGLAPHRLRLEPRPDAGQVLDRALWIEPLPVSRAVEADAAGNLSVIATFAGTTDQLRIVSRFVILTGAPPCLPAGGLPPLPWSPWADGPLSACLYEPQP